MEDVMAKRLYEYNEMIGARAARDQVFDLELFPGLMEDVIREHQELSLYLNRRGYLVHLAIGPAVVPDQIVFRARAGRLAGVRCIRILPEVMDFPRGRDELEVTGKGLDVLTGLLPDGTAVMLLPPRAEGDQHVTVIRYQSAAEACSQDFRGMIADVDRTMPEDRRKPVARKEAPKVLLIGILHLEGRTETGNDIGELARLARSGGYEPAAEVIQRMRRINPAIFIGRGKLSEARDKIMDGGLEAVILSEEIKYTQKRNLKKLLGVEVIDRTDLVLEIFSRYATTHEGRLQVKIALINQHIRQMVKEGRYLDQQAAGGRAGGGSGGALRGPGETSKEMKRRLIYQRKEQLEDQLARLGVQRKYRRGHRLESSLLRAACVGYTNAGKSSLLNALSGADVEVADRLFTTLETRTRRCDLGMGTEALVSDTVGFIRNLPHHLVHAFRSTLEEALDADVVLVVCDAADEHRQEHLTTVNDVLRELNADTLPRQIVFNKIDLLTEQAQLQLAAEYPAALRLSALTGAGLDELRSWLRKKSRETAETWELKLPYSQAGLLDRLYSEGVVHKQEYQDTGISVIVRVPPQLKRLVAGYRVTE